MSRGYRKSKWKFLGLAGMVLSIAGSIAMVFYMKYELRLCREQSEMFQEQLASFQRVVYVAAEKIPRGTVVMPEKLWQEIRYSDCPQEEFITEEHFGMKAVQDIEAGSCITKGLVYQEDNNVREVFIDGVDIPEHIQSGDRIDVRIRYGNAEEYIVLSDQCIKTNDSGRGMLLRLTEEEILFFSSAISDSELYEKTKIYVVEYPEYEIVTAGQVTYIPNRDILRLLGREKTEGESRDALEHRLLRGK